VKLSQNVVRSGETSPLRTTSAGKPDPVKGKGETLLGNLRPQSLSCYLPTLSTLQSPLNPRPKAAQGVVFCSWLAERPNLTEPV